MNEEVLEIEYEVDFPQFRKVWMEYVKKSLPNILAFWGVAILLSLGMLYLFENKYFGSFLTLLFLSIPLFSLYFSYQNFTKTARTTYEQMSADEKKVHITFKNGADGFDSRNGKNSSHTSWESIKGVDEFKDYFVFNRLGNYFYVPKNAFRNDTEIKFLRFLVSVNVNKNTKLLE